MTSFTEGDLNYWKVHCGKAVPLATATNTYLNCDQQRHSETPLTTTTKSPLLGFRWTHTGFAQSLVPIRATMDSTALVRSISGQGLAQRAGHQWRGQCSVQSSSATLKLDLYLSPLSMGSMQLCVQNKLLDEVRPDILLQMHATWPPAPSRDVEIWTNKEDTSLQTIPKKALNHWELLHHLEVLLTLWKETSGAHPLMFADNQQPSNGCDSLVVPHIPLY